MFAKRIIPRLNPLIRCRTTRNFWSFNSSKEASISATSQSLETKIIDPTVTADIQIPDGTELLKDNPVILEAITKIGDMKLLGICNNNPVGWIQSAYEMFYVSTGMPWWATLLVATIGIRFLMFPVLVKAQQGVAKLHNIKPQMEPLQTEMMRLKGMGDEMGSMEQARKLRALFTENKVSPLSALWGLVQMPVLIGSFFAVQGMCEVKVPGLTTEGLWWFTDLTVPDPTYLLPAISAVCVLASIELGAEMSGNVSPGMRTFMRVMMVVGVYAMSWLPSAVFLYTIAGALFTIVQVYAFNQPTIRKMLNIPQLNKNVKPKQGMLAFNPMSNKEAKEALKAAMDTAAKKS